MESKQKIYIHWDSQPLKLWTETHAKGEVTTIDGKQTHYIVKGNGPSIILIHGFLFDSSCWQYTIDTLARNYRVYAIDLWGFGYSTREPLQLSYQLFSNQILFFMDQLNIDHTVLVGQSLGGGIAMTFAVEHPDRVSQLVLVDAAGLPNPEPISARMFMLPGVGEFLLRLPVDAIRRRMLNDFFLFDPAVITPEQFQLLFWSQKIAGSIASALSIMRGRFADKLEASIKQLATTAVPILVIWGENDRAISPEIGRSMHACLPDSEFVLLESAGHVPNLEQPQAFNRALLAFLSRP